MPSDTTASSDSLSFIGNTVSRRMTPAILTRCRSGASAIRTEPGTFSAHSRISGFQARFVALGQTSKEAMEAAHAA